MASDAVSLVLRAALFASLAIAAMLLTRAPLRRWLGATVAYQAWVIVPLATAAAMLPMHVTPSVMALPALRTVQGLAAQATPLAASRADQLLLVWMLGAVLSVVWFVAGHRAFVRMAGTLTPSGDLHVSDADIGPASVGLLSPRIVVPHDFAQRYSPLEQSLVITHERTHIARHDAVANLLAALFQCALWFNPLVHAAVRCFRQDQELSCDAITIMRHPGARRAYAEALLKFHGGALPAHAVIHCHWQTRHPLKERLMNLQHIPPGTVRRLAGRCLIALLAVSAIGGTLGARAQASSAAPTYRVAMVLATGDAPSSPHVVSRAGEPFAVTSGEWRVDMTVRQADTPGDVWLAGKIFKSNEMVSAPTLLTRLNAPATIRVGDSDALFTLSMTVSLQP